MKNTALLIIFLSIFAALVVGVNIGRNFNNNQDTNISQTTPSITSIPTPDEPKFTAYRNSNCGITLDHPINVQKVEAADGNVIFIDKENPDKSVLMICQKNIAEPAGEKIEEEIKIGSASAFIYQENSKSSSSSATYHLFFKNPVNKLSILVSGMGSIFESILRTIEISN